ncbi:hypothetical protein [Flavobacterium pedocola]
MGTLQKIRIAGFALLVVTAVSFTSCRARAGVSVGVGGSSSRTAPKSKPLPPGQAKKIYGGKSAKKYAPGQQNKQ